MKNLKTLMWKEVERRLTAQYPHWSQEKRHWMAMKITGEIIRW